MIGALFVRVERVLETRFRFNESRRHLAILTGASLFTYAMAILLSPLWSRLYPVEYFAVSALMQATAALVSSWATLAYHNAVHTPAEEREAFSLVLLALGAVGTCGLGLAAICIFAAPWVSAQLGGSGQFQSLVWLAPVIMFSGGVSATLDQWMVRNRRYVGMAKVLVLQAMLPAIVPALGLLQRDFTNFILLGTVTSGLLGIAMRLRYSGFFASLKKFGVTLADLREAAIRRANFPRDILPGNMLSELSAQMPQVMIARNFPIETVGFYARAGTLLVIPMSIMGGTVGAMFSQQAGAAYRETGDCRPIFRRRLGMLFLALAPLYLVLFFVTPWLYPWFYGPSWVEAGRLAQPLCVYYFVASMGSVLSGVLKFGSNTKWDLAWQVARVLAVAGALTWGARTGSVLQTLYWYAIVHALMYALYIALCYWRARQVGFVALAPAPESEASPASAEKVLP